MDYIIVLLLLLLLLSHFSRVRLCVTPQTTAHQAPLSLALSPQGLQSAMLLCPRGFSPLSIGILQQRILEWVAMPPSRGSSQPRDQT